MNVIYCIGIGIPASYVVIMTVVYMGSAYQQIPLSFYFYLAVCSCILLNANFKKYK